MNKALSLCSSVFAALPLLCTAWAEEASPPPAEAVPVSTEEAEALLDAAALAARQREYEEEYRRRYSEVLPQPADGVYTVTEELPDHACFWMCRATLRPGEDMGTFLRRAYEEYGQQVGKLLKAVEVKGGVIIMDDPEAPPVEVRGIMLCNPAAPEAYREVPWPCGRDCAADELDKAAFYNLFLGVTFKPEGILVRKGKGYALNLWLIAATDAPQFWKWSEAEAFLAALPDLMQADPSQVEDMRPPNVELSPPLRERVESGRRMMMFHMVDGLPMEQCWETYAKMVALVGGQSITYSLGPNAIRSREEVEAHWRRLESPWPPEPEQARPRIVPPPTPAVPEIEVQLELDMPAED